MVLALLHESELVLSEDVVEMIVDKVQIHPIHLIRYWSYLFTGIHYDKLSLL